MTKRTATYGPEPWLTVGGVNWCHWDLWFCLVARLDHSGDLAALADAVAARDRWGGSGSERKLSHLDDLTARLAAAGLTADALLAHADDRPALRAKARKKVLEQEVSYERELTPAMRSTPRKRLYERALRGRWERFTASPQPWHDRLVNHLGEGWLHKNATLRLERRIESARDRHDRATASDPAQRLAWRRALVTYMYETMARCDDSYGVLGTLGREAILTYAKLPTDDADISPKDWCEDLCELLVWEDYGLLDRETAAFANVHGALADHAERFLLALADELRAARLPRQAGVALQHIAYLHVAHGRTTRFEAVAAALGSDHWRPIVTMAQAAIARGRPDVARATFAAADRPGMQREYLRKRCAELTGAPPAPGHRASLNRTHQQP